MGHSCWEIMSSLQPEDEWELVGETECGSEPGWTALWVQSWSGLKPWKFPIYDLSKVSKFAQVADSIHF